MLGPASKRQEQMLNSDADITIIGGSAASGKSYVLNLIPLRYIHDPNFAGICFRRTTRQLRGQGGMWQTAKSIYRQLPKHEQPSFRESDLTMNFPNGASLAFSHLEHDKNAEDHQGLQYSLQLWDELSHFTWYQFEYLLSRLRSGAKMKSRLVASCNPSPDHFTLDLISWWLNAEGFPDDAKRGKLRYFVRRDDKFIWASDPKELDHYMEEEGEAPTSVEFVAANIYDNPPCMKKNPGYLSRLKSLNKIDKARLLYGNWYVRPQGSNYFKREDLNLAETIPHNALCCRAWDKAATEPSDVNPYPDYTACIKMYKTRDSEYYITGEFDVTNHDAQDPDIHGRFRHKPGKRDNIILRQALFDGPDCPVIMPVDPGAHGLVEFIESAKKLSQEGFIVKKDVVAPQRSKLQKFMPISAAIENGFVHIVEETFNKQTLEALYKELESFDGKRSGKLRKDDWADVLATAYNYLAINKNYKIVVRNQMESKSLAEPVLNLMRSGVPTPGGS